MNPEQKLYLAFPDGAFSYDCRACPSCCCRGPFLALTPDELEAFFSGDAMALRARVLAGPYVYIEVGPRGCPLVDSDNRCTVALESGKKAMPLLCRLFPLSRTVKVGRWLAVRPDFGVCPLRLVLPPRSGLPGSHADVEEALAGQELSPFNLHEAKLQAGDSDEALVAREVAFRDRCTATLAEARASRGPGVDVESVLTRLGIPWAPPSRSSDLLAVALAPSLRLSLLHLPAGRLDLALELWRRLLAEALLHRPQGPSEPCRDDPNCSSAALRSGASQSSTKSRQGARDASAAFCLLDGLAPAVSLLTLGDSPLEREAVERLTVPRFRQLRATLAAAVLRRELERGAGMASALERALDDSFGPAERVAFLVQVGQALEA